MYDGECDRLVAGYSAAVKSEYDGRYGFGSGIDDPMTKFGKAVHLP